MNALRRNTARGASSANHACRAAMCAIMLASLSVAVGCGNSATKPELCAGVTLISQNGSGLFARAQDSYGKIRLRDLQGKQLEAEVSDVLKLLDGAITNDRRCVLFLSKMGEMRLEAGQVDQASTYFDRSRALCQDWVPAWIGLADVATRRGNYQAALSYLNSAQAALEKVQGTTKPKEKQPDFFAIIGLSVPRDETPGRDPDDPTLSDDEKLRLIVNWLQASEAWTIENPGLLSQMPGGLVVQQGKLFRRLRANIAYHRVLVRMAEGSPASKLKEGLDYALQWDPDYFPAKIEMVSILRQEGDYQNAERLLRPYFDSDNPILSNNGRLLYEMASIYTDWYKQDKSAETADLADAFFTRLHNANDKHAHGYIKRADLYLHAGAELKRADTLNTAITCLDRAKAALGDETAEIALLRKQIKAAQAKIGS